jgi:hypothetical protein
MIYQLREMLIYCVFYGEPAQLRDAGLRDQELSFVLLREKYLIFI